MTSATVRAMSWTLPVPLVLIAAAAALTLVPALARRPVSRPRLVVEAFGTTVAVIAVVWLGGLLLWWIEQRW